MRLRSHDQVFVAVPPEDVDARLADGDGYPVWWPGSAVSADGLLLALGRERLSSRIEGRREAIGMWLPLPDLDGSVEWYLEPFEEGTIVNAFLDVVLENRPRAAARRLRRMRISVHRALVSLKRSMEGR